jgi:hypothetical protein
LLIKEAFNIKNTIALSILHGGETQKKVSWKKPIIWQDSRVNALKLKTKITNFSHKKIKKYEVNFDVYNFKGKIRITYENFVDAG